MAYRVLLVAFVSCAYLFGGPQVPKDHQTSADASAKTRGQTNRVIPPTHVIIDQPYPTISTKAEAPQEQNKPQDKPLPGFVQFTKPEWVIVYVTAIYVLINWWMLRAIKRQGGIMEQQTKEARESSTTASAIAAGTLNAIRREADWMETQAGHMREQLGVMQRQAEYMGEGLALTKITAELSQKTLVVTQGPYIYITKTTLRPLRIGEVPTVDMGVQECWQGSGCELWSCGKGDSRN